MMLNIILKPCPARFRIILLAGTILLASLLAIRHQMVSSAGPARDNPVLQTSDDDKNPAQDSHQSQNKSKSPAERRPIILLYEINPWLMVLGSDSPAFALYGDGLVIFVRAAEGGGREYASLILDEHERDALISALPTKEFFGLEPRYETTGATDQPTTVISLWNDDQVKTVSVYGGLKIKSNQKGEGAPQVFIETYEKLKGLDNARAATKWMPEKVEMMIWPYENAGETLAWPKNWPGTRHPETRKRGDGQDQISYSIYLSPAQYETLKRQASKKSLDAVLIDGRKWAFSFRFPFPNEDSWRKR
ncbi:MAG TPA: hypothetical protein VF791_17025 [Pyrinomonadaceae bacterium]